nr:SCO6880 family protein [Georgenia subflava]
MPATAEPGHHVPRTYGNWRRPTSPGLMGLGTVGTMILMGGLIVVVLVVMLSDLLRGLAVAAGLAVLLMAIAVRDKHGLNALDKGSARVGWWRQRSAGEHLYRSGPLGQVPWGTNQLPGLAAASKLSEHSDSYGRRFALLRVPSTSTFTIVIGTEPDGAALVDEEQVDAWVSDWGLWLANLGDEPGIVAASVTVETAPDTGTRLRREVATNIDPDAPEFARALLAETVRDYPSGSSTVRAYVALSFAAARGGKKRSAAELARELGARLPGLTGELQATGAGPAHPLDAQELCELVRVAYDPASATAIDELHARGEATALSWSDVGPSAAEATWDDYRHDSGLSVTWAMTGAPRGNVQSSILARLLAPHRDVARKRVTLLYRPIDAASAAAIVEADLRAAQFRQTSSDKPTARDVLATRAAALTAQEEAAGAGLVNFGMLVTATVLDVARAADAHAAVENLSATARLRLRPVYGSQDSAFAAALPLGLVLPRHLALPGQVRDRL